MEGHKEARHRFEVFRDGLKQLGWVEGRNVHFDVRPVGGKREVMQTATAEILALRPDVILANGATVLSTLLQHTRTVPIVFVQVADPVAGGFITSLAKPGGNVTGFVNFEYAIAGKWVTLLREIAPRANHITGVLDPLLGTSAGVLGAVQAVCSALGLQLNVISVRDGTEIDHAFSALAHELDTGFIVLPGPTSTTNYERFIALAARQRNKTRECAASAYCCRSAITTLRYRPASRCSKMGSGSWVGRMGATFNLMCAGRKARMITREN